MWLMSRLKNSLLTGHELQDEEVKATKLTTLTGVGDHYEFSDEEAARKCAEDIDGELCVFPRTTGKLWIVCLNDKVKDEETKQID